MGDAVAFAVRSLGHWAVACLVFAAGAGRRVERLFAVRTYTGSLLRGSAVKPGRTDHAVTVGDWSPQRRGRSARASLNGQRGSKVAVGVT
jgi:hypothetical protein